MENSNTSQTLLMNLESPLNREELILGVVSSNSRHDNNFEIEYKIKSKTTLLSSGHLTMDYIPIPDGYEMSPAYPNPFNPKTTIKYGLPRDSDVVTEEDLLLYSSALQRNGFFGPSSRYMNHSANAVYAGKAENSGYLDMPALFVTAKYDFVCECVHSDLAGPMRTYCRRLSEETVDAGHWVAQEKPYAVNASLVKWVVTMMPGVWESAR